jgi:hypothetical protein
MGDGMRFTLRNVGASCYALWYNEKQIGSVFCSDGDHAERWVAMIHEPRPKTLPLLPAPFRQSQHRFATLQAVREWLGESVAPATQLEAG